MPEGKPAGTSCVQLDAENMCRLFGLADRPEVCQRFQASEEWCGETRHEALERLNWLERQTQ